MSIISTIIGISINIIKKVISKFMSVKYKSIIWAIFVVSLIFPIANPIQFEQKVIFSNSFVSHLMIIISNVWFVMVIFRLAVLIWQYKWYNIINIKNYEIRTEKMKKILEKCKKRLNIKRNIRMIKQERIKGPVIIGMIDVRILLTDEILKLSETELEYIVMHELAHYKRGDIFLEYFCTIIEKIYCFNPFIKLLFNNMKNDNQFAADELAISKMGEEEKREYCKSFIKVYEICYGYSEEKSDVIAIPSTIEKRIDTIFLKNNSQINSNLVFCFIIVITMAIWLAFCYI